MRSIPAGILMESKGDAAGSSMAARRETLPPDFDRLEPFASEVFLRQVVDELGTFEYKLYGAPGRVPSR